MAELDTVIDATLARKAGNVLGVATSVISSITDAQTAADDAQGTADTALANAATALAAANEADDTADAAQTTATAAANALTAHQAVPFAHAGTLAQLNASISDADVPALAGQLGGTTASPEVRGIRETGGPTALTIGAIPDGSYIKRSGSNVVGQSVNDTITELVPKQTWYPPTLAYEGASVATTSQRACALYMGYFRAGLTIEKLLLFQGVLAVGAGQAELALAWSSAAPDHLAATNTLNIVAASLIEDMTVGATSKHNASQFAYTLDQPRHIWGLYRGEFATTQPSVYHATRFRSVVSAQIKTSQPSLLTLVGSAVSSWTSGLSVPFLLLGTI